MKKIKSIEEIINDYDNFIIDQWGVMHDGIFGYDYAFNSINILNNKNINELKEKEKILKDLENKIISKKNIMSKENFDKEVLLFKNKANEFKEDQFKMTEDFNDYKKKELDGILSKISPIINAYIEKKSVKILLDSKNILIGRSNLNLTNEVLKEINEKIK